jgi:parallel beta-helix repeat protein
MEDTVCSNNAESGIFIYLSDLITVTTSRFVFNGKQNIELYQSSNCSFDANTFIGGEYGLYSYTSNSCQMRNNVFQLQSKTGIRFYDSDFITISGTTINKVANSGIEVIDSNSCNIFNNTISYANEGIVLRGCFDSFLLMNTCSESFRGIVINSGQSIVTDNICQNNYQGIQVSQSVNCSLKENRCTGNDDGILLSRSDHIEVTNNTCNENRDGIVLLAKTNNCTLLNNRIEGNLVGIRLVQNCENTTALFNSIVNNTEFGITASNNNGFMIDATYNWWGNSSGPHHEANNSEGAGDTITDLVLFEPWLDEHGQSVFFPDEPDDDSPNWPPLALLIIILVLLFSTLVSTIRTSHQPWGTEDSSRPSEKLAPKWVSPGREPSPDGAESPGRQIVCQYCSLPFSIPMDEQGIRVQCPKCGENTLASIEGS